MKISIPDKVTIITGGASGIGESMAHTFATSGGIVCLLDRDPEKSQKVVDTILASGGEASHYICDVSNTRDVTLAIEQINQKYGKIDIAIANAGIAQIGSVENTSEADLDRIYAVNIKGVYNIIHAVIPYMKEKKNGVILNMASIAASVGINDRFGYSMTKGAVLAMTYSVAKDYLAYNIRCNAISPARVHTPFVDAYLARNYPGREQEMFEKLSQTQPIGRMGEPREIAELALYLCSDHASFITGSDIPIDGGFIKLNGN